MIYPEIPLAQSIIAICKAKAIKNIIISPGSRNAPLTIGFASNTNFKCYSIADERCAAFFALGIAQQTNEPAAIICTSGSALLNYYPAVAEAFYSQIPLLIISADRPHDKIDIGDGQTIRQENVFANHILYNANLKEIASEENDLKINEAINTSIFKKGPVHINAPFEEPLYSIVSEISVNPKIVSLPESKNSFQLQEKYLLDWNTSSKKLILVGELKPNSIENAIIEQLAKEESVVVMTEVTSNLHHKSFIGNIDAIITPFTEEDFEKFKPELLITFGGMVVSKRIKAFLRKHKPNKHWHIDELRAYDTYGCLTDFIETKPNIFFKELLSNYKCVSSNYKFNFSEIVRKRTKKHEQYISSIPFSDFQVFSVLAKQLSGAIQLQISNSSAIRYFQLFNLNPSVEVFCNRGTSGIDGSTSTAIGAATTSSKPTILVTGDISFLYDSNALWNDYVPNNFKIILVNNSGGGIFRILPGHEENEVFNTFFETSHNLDASHLAEMYNFNYQLITDNDNLALKIKQFLEDFSAKAILEIKTPEKLNDKILLEYFKKLK
uniref:2-succinyl-5-enolpyruvyl-6-hydroxy-3- cyclohexene-1-carboxylic-acid synthase n=1 Tax=Flavobacterium sp. TaxID=239 RepID=UPI004049FD54